MKVVNNGIKKLIKINYVTRDPLKNLYKHKFFIFLTVVINFMLISEENLWVLKTLQGKRKYIKTENN
jgi:hypothetical protein